MAQTIFAGVRSYNKGTSSADDEFGLAELDGNAPNFGLVYTDMATTSTAFGTIAQDQRGSYGVFTDDGSSPIPGGRCIGFQVDAAGGGSSDAVRTGRNAGVAVNINGTFFDGYQSYAGSFSSGGSPLEAGVTISQPNTTSSDSKHILAALKLTGAQFASGNLALGTQGTTHDITTPGFKPDIVLFQCHGNINDGTIKTGFAGLSYGVAHNDSTVSPEVLTQRSVVMAASNDEEGGQQFYEDCVAAQVTTLGAGSWRLIASDFDASGFSVQVQDAASGGDEVQWIAIKLGDAANEKVKLFTYTAPADTGNQAITDPGFTPEFVLSHLSDCTAVATTRRGTSLCTSVMSRDGTNMAISGTSFGESTGASGPRHRVMTNAHAIYMLDRDTIESTIAVNLQATVSSWDANGFTLNYTTAALGGSPSRQVKGWMLALGPGDFTEPTGSPGSPGPSSPGSPGGSPGVPASDAFYMINVI